MYKNNILNIYPLINKVTKSKINIGYDFDGVLHRDINKYTINGQGHPFFKKNIKDYIPNLNIIDKIKREIFEGNNVYIITRNPNDKSDFLKKYNLDYFLENNHIFVASIDKPKYKYIEELNITEFTEDSINELNNIIDNISHPIKLFLILTFKNYSDKEAEIINYSKENRKEINKLFYKYLKYSGSGVFLISLLENEPIIFLIQEKNNEYSDPGGQLETENNIIENAIRELQEETFSTFILNKEGINDEESCILNTNYKSYYYYIQFNNDFIKEYKKNLKCIINKNINNVWKETKNMLYFKLNDIKNINSSKLINGYDENNEEIKNCKISDRVINSLHTFINKKKIVDLNKYFKTKKFNKLKKEKYMCNFDNCFPFLEKIFYFTN